MLTADLVNARRKGTELRLVALTDESRARARAIAREMVSRVSVLAARGSLAARKDVEDALSAVEADARDQRLKAGLKKLVLDRCTFEAEPELDPESLRREVWEHAARARKAGTFVRADILAAVARSHQKTPDAIEAALFSDLRGAHKLLAFAHASDAALVSAYEQGQAQAVLLRATKIVVDIVASAGATRALFHKLKFLRLLHVLERTEHGHRITIDGPFSLFESATKYGLELAMVLPALEGCDAFTLDAEVLWGKERTRLAFRLEGGDLSHVDRATSDVTPARVPRAATLLADDMKALAAQITALDQAWTARPANAILELRGVGLCVPDLVLSRDGTDVYVESMGYWSRDAVWKRVELVEAGLTAPVLFLVSERLRVSEAVLAKDASAALYVYKGTMHARAVLLHLTRLWTTARSRSEKGGNA